MLGFPERAARLRDGSPTGRGRGAVALLLVFAALLSAPLPAAAASLADAMPSTTVRVACLASASAGGSGIGSGFVVGTADHVVTNWHPVACSERGGAVRVLLGPKESLDASVRWHSETQDLAVLRLGRGLDRVPASFASGRTVEPLDPIIAAGFPGAADALADAGSITVPSLTSGRVSRLVTLGGVRLIQHEAAISPGSSGGPLFDEIGRVIGINTLKSLTAVPTLAPDGRGGVAMSVERVTLGEGIGTAVSVDELLPELDRLGIPYRVSHSRPGAFTRLWHQTPLLVVTLAVLGLISLGAVRLARSANGRARVRKAFTRGASRSAVPAGPATPSPPVKTPATRPLLRGVSGPNAGMEIPLGAEPVAIGRDPEMSNVVIPRQYPGVSKRHLLVRLDPRHGGFLLEDCWSTNGSFLADGKPLTPGEPLAVAPGTRFYLSTRELMFEVVRQ